MFNLQAHMVVKFLELIDGVFTLTEVNELISSIDKLLFNLMVEVYAHVLIVYLKLHSIVIRINFNTMQFCAVPTFQWIFRVVQKVKIILLNFRFKMYRFYCRWKGNLTSLRMINDLIITRNQVFFRSFLKCAIRLRTGISPLYLRRK